MDTQKLEEYLKIVVDLEKDKYTQERTITKLNQQIKSYESQVAKNKSLVRGAQYIKERSAIDASDVIVDKSGKGIAMFAIYYFAVLGAIILGKIAELTGGAKPVVLIFGVLGAIVGGSIPWKIWRNILNKRRQEEINRINALQEADKKEINVSIRQTVAFEKAIPEFKNRCVVIKSTYDTTCKTLRDIYDVGIIPPKYRGIIPVCMFYDYISNKRTYSLERQGADPGAINMYEEEVWKKIIVDKFDEAIHRLEMIREEQKIFYNSMIEAQNRSNVLLNTINDNITGFRKDVNEKMDVLTYKTDQNLKCNQYMAYVAYQGYMKS